MAYEFKIRQDSCSFNLQDSPIKFSIGDVKTVYIDRPEYEGSYTVVPAVDDQVLDTEGKVMRDDMTVTGVPYYKVSNLQQGYTIIIGD